MAIYGNASGGAFVNFQSGGTYSTAGDELLLKAQMGADEKWAKIKAAAKPDLSEYEKDLEKLKALPGEKNYIQSQYISVMNGLKKGADKYGGWISYSNTEDYKKQLGKLNNWAYNTAKAELEYDKYHEMRKMMKPEDLSAIFLKNGSPVWIGEGKNKRMMTNDEAMTQIANNGLNVDENGRLAALPFSIELGSRKDFINDVQSMTTHLGSDTFETPFKVVQEIVQTAGGPTNFLQAGTNTITSNHKQVNAAANAIIKNMSPAGKNGLLRSYYESGQASKIGWGDFVVNETLDAVRSMRETKVTNNMGITKLGAEATEAASNYPKTDYWGSVFNGGINTTNPIPQDRSQYIANANGEFEKEKIPTWHVGLNKEAVEKVFPIGSELKQPFYFEGVMHSSNPGKGQQKIPAGLKVTNVLGVQSNFFKFNENTGDYDILATADELKKAGIIADVNDPKSLKETNVNTAESKNFRYRPSVQLEVSSTVNGIINQDANLYGVVEDEKRRKTMQPALSTSFFSKYGFGDIGTGGDSYLENWVINKKNNGSDNLTVDDTKDGVFEWGGTGAVVKAKVIVPVNPAASFSDGAVSHGYEAAAVNARTSAEELAQRRLNQSKQSMRGLYPSLGK